MSVPMTNMLELVIDDLGIDDEGLAAFCDECRAHIRRIAIERKFGKERADLAAAFFDQAVSAHIVHRILKRAGERSTLH
jgi:hypothetical protein